MNQQNKTVPVKINFPRFNTVSSLITVALKPWIVMLSAWCFFVGSILFSWEVPASGAVLVCGALISEILYFKQRWTKMNTDPSGSFPLKPDSNTGLPVIWGQFVVAGAGSGKLGHLLSLAKEGEVRIDTVDNSATWFYMDTVARVEIIVLSAIVFTAVSGTAVWGYGHLIFN